MSTLTIGLFWAAFSSDSGSCVGKIQLVLVEMKSTTDLPWRWWLGDSACNRHLDDISRPLFRLGSSQLYTITLDFIIAYTIVFVSQYA